MPKELEALQQERPGHSSDYGPHMHNANRPDDEQLSSKSTIRRVLTGAAFAVLALSLLSVNTFPSINNDGVEYIGYSQSLIDGGLVRLGSRQIGYPLVLAIERFVAQFAGVEALLFSVLVQRLLLVVAVLYSVWLWRWRSTPLVLLAITPSFLAYTDLIMTESLTISLALLLACLVAHHFRSVEPTAKPTILMGRVLSARKLALISASAAAFIAFALLVVRYPFAVFGVVPLAIWIAARRRGDNTAMFIVPLLAYLVSAGLFTAVLMTENSTELGVATANARTERSAYWAAWHVTFTLHSENQTNPALAEYYDNGSPYFHIWDLESENPEYVDQVALYKGSTSELLLAADLDPTTERLLSFLGALRGGRLDDVGPRVEMILATDATSVEDAIHVNDVSKRQGRDSFNERYNEGHKPQAMITSPVFPAPPVPYVADLLGVLLPVALATTWVLAIRKRQAALAVVYAIPVLVFSAAVAWVLADNVRFLITTSVYAIAGMSALWAASDRREMKHRG